MEVQSGNTIKVHYTGTLSSGTQFDSSYDRKAPIQFQVGEGTVIPGFDKAVVGMSVGDKKTITIPTNEAYGEKTQEAVIDVPKNEFPPNFNFTVGEGVQGMAQDGQPIMGVILEEKESTVTIDFNHPLSGEELTFDIEVMEIA